MQDAWLHLFDSMSTLGVAKFVFCAIVLIIFGLVVTSE